MRMTRKLYRNPLLPLILITLLLPAAGCNYGVFGKKMAPVITHLDNTLGKSVDTTVRVIDKARADVLNTLNATRDTIFDFLKNHSEREAHDISVGILEGTIGYLDQKENRQALADWLEAVINSTVGPVREQLITLRNQLIDTNATKNLRLLLQGIMKDLVLNPTASLLNIAIGDKTRGNLDRMLRMLIPAILNDSAIGQIAKLRDTLLGFSMKKQIAGLVDTALLVANGRLDSPIGKTISKIVDDNTHRISNAAWLIIIALGLGILAMAFGAYLLRQRIKQREDMLTQVTMQIEQMNKPGTELQNQYKDLTKSIAHAMATRNLEVQMNKFLKDRNIS
jgi:hypothetical protein